MIKEIATRIETRRTVDADPDAIYGIFVGLKVMREIVKEMCAFEPDQKYPFPQAVVISGIVATTDSGIRENDWVLVQIGTTKRGTAKNDQTDDER